MATNYGGNDLEEWFNHFNFTEKLRNVLQENFEAKLVEDLAYVYDDPEMLKDVENAVARLEYRKFLDVRRKTTLIAPPETTPPSTSSTPPPAPFPSYSMHSVTPPPPPALTPTAPPPPSTFDLAMEAKRRELLEMERKLEKEKEKHRRAVEKTKAIEKKKKLIPLLEEKIRRAASLDIVFLLDCTGSMSSYIEATKTNITEFVTNIKSLHPGVSLRLAFIGYRDHCDKEERLAVMRFTLNIEEFKTMVGSQVAKGGGDDAEDVLGGLHVVRALEWESETRILYHIGDAPCHGSEYHSASCSDDYPQGDPNGLMPGDILLGLKANKVQYFFGKIKDKTDIMISKFNEFAGNTNPPYIITTPMTASGDMMSVITKSVTTTFSESLSASARTDDGKVSKRDVVLDPTVPRWEVVAVESTLRFEMKMPKSLDELFDNITYSDDDDCISDFPDRELFRVKVAPSPFAKGEMRAAYYGQLITGLTTSTAIVLKESLAKSPEHLTKERYQAFLACHRAAKALSIEFNRVKPESCPCIDFCDACIIQFMQRREPINQPFMIQESQIPDTFEKYNNNSGFCAPNPSHITGTNHAAVQAFSHWTYQVSNERMLVVDCQGGYNAAERRFLLTDPAVHFVDVTRFGGTNMGRPGMGKFFETHKCNEFCQALKLTRPATTTST
mmetsp:Transcript_26853/g.29279  ORF Transcript_26853/g.29279 Transcript_26853/m.29279 type:complete len:670 (-) Transcript_26853:21-2030(-)